MKLLRPLAIAAVLTVALAVPTAAVTFDTDEAGAIELEPTSPYASIDTAGDLRLDFDRLNDRAVTTVDGLFELTVTDEATHAVWIDHDVDGLTFYADGDRDQPFDEANALDVETGETVVVGVSIDTQDAPTGTETFTVHAVGDEADPPDGGPIRPPGGTEPSPVDPPADEPDEEGISVTDAAVDRETVDVGESVEVRATVTNDGDAAESASIALEVGGVVVDTQAVALDPGESTTVTFEWTPTSPGSYDIAVSGVDAGSVTAEDPREFDTVERLTPSPKEIVMAGPVAFGLVALGSVIRGRRHL